MTQVVQPTPQRLRGPALIDTSVWSWVRDRRFRHLAEWFNASVSDAYVLTCDLVVIELTRATANAEQAASLRRRVAPIERAPMGSTVWDVAADIQIALAATGDHRRVPPADLLIAATAISAGVPVLHYDRDYERIAAVTDLHHRWFVPDGSLAA